VQLENIPDVCSGLNELFIDVGRALLARDLTMLKMPPAQKITQEGLKKPVEEKTCC